MKNYLLGALFVVTTQCCMAQLSINYGGTVFTSLPKKVNTMQPFIKNGIFPDTNFNTYKVSVLALGLIIYPKYHFLKSARNSVSVGVPLSIGISPNIQTASESMVSLMYDINLNVDLNGGRLSKGERANDTPFGYYIGLGVGFTNPYGIHYEDQGNPSKLTKDSKDLIVMKSNQYIGDIITGKSYGVIIHCGLTSEQLGSEGSSYCLRLFVKPAFQKNDFTLYGGGFCKTLRLHYDD